LTGAALSRAVEGDLVVRAGAFAVLHLGLGDGGAEGDVPDGRRLDLVSLTAGEVAKERALGDLLGDRGDRLVRLRPVDAQTQPAEIAFEVLLILSGEGEAQLDEIAPGDRLRAGLLRH